MNKTLENDLTMTIRVKGRTKKLNVSKLLKISGTEPQILIEEMIEQPRLFAWIGVLRAMAQDTYERQKTEVKRVYAQRDKYHRRRREAKKLRASEKIIEADVLVDAEYKEATDKLEEAKYNYEVLNVITEAFEQRKDMLQSTGAFVRKEYGELNLDNLKEKARERVQKG